MLSHIEYAFIKRWYKIDQLTTLIDSGVAKQGVRVERLTSTAVCTL